MARDSAPRFGRGDAISVSKLNRVAEMAARALDVQGPNLSVGSDGIRLRPLQEDSFLAEILGNDGGTPAKHSWRAVVENSDGTLSAAEPAFSGSTTMMWAVFPGGGAVPNNSLVRLRKGLSGEWYEIVAWARSALLDVSGRSGSVSDVLAAQFERTVVGGTPDATVITPDDASKTREGDVNLLDDQVLGDGHKIFSDALTVNNDRAVTTTQFQVLDSDVGTSLSVGDNSAILFFGIGNVSPGLVATYGYHYMLQNCTVRTPLTNFGGGHDITNNWYISLDAPAETGDEDDAFQGVYPARITVWERIPGTDSTCSLWMYFNSLGQNPDSEGFPSNIGPYPRIIFRGYQGSSPGIYPRLCVANDDPVSPTTGGVVEGVSGTMLYRASATSGLVTGLGAEIVAADVTDFAAAVIAIMESGSGQAATQAAISVADTSTVDLTYSSGVLSADVITQMSITSDGSGLKLSGDDAAPGGDFMYATDSGGTKTWRAIPLVSVSDTDTVDLTLSSADLSADVKYQQSITADSSGLTLDGDDYAPGTWFMYGTNGSGDKGFNAFPQAANVASLTDSTGGTPGATLDAISGTGEDTIINDNFASLNDKLDEILASLQGTTPALMAP